MDLGTDQAGRSQETISLQGVATKKGELVFAALVFTQVRHANATCLAKIFTWALLLASKPSARMKVFILTLCQ